MKDLQYGPPTQKNWNGGIMSGSSGGGGRRPDGGGQRGGQHQGGSGYPHWPPHPMHHHMQSQHAQLPRMMGGYYGGRGLPPAAAHFGSGSWGRPSSGGNGQSSGLKPPDRWAPVGSSTTQQAEGGMDLSQSRPNGSQPNGVAKEPVSVIAANPLRSGEKPLEPSDRSEDEDEDCMVIEEGEEAPHLGELPPRQSALTRDEDIRQRLSREDMSRHELPPAAHLNPLRQPSLPIGIRPEVSHHLPPSVTQPLRSTDNPSQLQMLQKSSQLLQGLASSSSLQKLSRMDSTSPLQKPGSPLLPASPLGQKSPSPSLLAQQQQVLQQFAQQFFAQKQIQDSQLLAAAQQKLPESAFQQLLVQQKLLSTNASATVEAAHQMMLGQQMSQLAGRQQDLSSKSSHMKPQPKSSSPAHTPSNPAHLKMGTQGSSHFSPRETFSHHQSDPLTVPHVEVKQRLESANIPHLPINIPSSLQVIPHPKNSSPLLVQDRLEVTPSCKPEVSEPEQNFDLKPDPLPQVQDRLENTLEGFRPDSSEPNQSRVEPVQARVELYPPSIELNPRIGETATAPVATPALPSPASTSQSNDDSSELKPSEECSDEKSPLEPPLSQSNLTEPPQPSEQISQVEISNSDKITNQQNTATELTQVERVNSVPEKPVEEPKKEIIPSTVDHVESMLENLFQQDDINSGISDSTLPSEKKTQALTEVNVVEILLDKDDVKPDIKQEIKTEKEVKLEPSTPQKFMQVESELEKMFAGIMETPGDSDTKPETPESSTTLKSTAKKRVRRPRSKKDSTRSSTKKKRNKSPLSAEQIRLKKRFGPKAEKIKEGSNDSSSISTDRQIYKSRGPCIKVVRDKDGTPSSVTIVNSSASNEDDKDKSIDKVTKRKPRIIEGRTKGPGLYSSTLSSKYNSTTIDVTWTCIFCNRRSHCEGGLGGEPAGDLFGPYLVHIKVEPISGCPSDVDIVNEQRKRGGGKQLSLRAGGNANHSFSPPHKKSRKSSTSEKDSTVIEEVPSNCSSTTISKEVWLHEACALWAPGVILVGPHLIGLDDAVSLSLHSKCGVCGETGACISCLQHGCHLVCHYGCALATKWSLDEQTFHARCVNHKKPLSISQALQQHTA